MSQNPYPRRFATVKLLLLTLSFLVASAEIQLGRHSPNYSVKAAKPQNYGHGFNGPRAMQYVKEIVNMGPRPVGSVGHRKLESYLRTHLSGDVLEEDVFEAEAPVGPLVMRNFIAKFPGTTPGIIVIGSHYDTNFPLKNYVGANDGGSSTGLLLEIANQLRRTKRDGYSIWLVWFDGEEAIRKWSDTDSLYGSRHLAAKWKGDGTLRNIKALFIADMIGDADLNVDRDDNSTPALLDLVQLAATNLGFQSHFFARTIAIEDDHSPFARLGVPVADVIDFNYGYNNVYHHTSEDTLDKLSVNSLQIVGDVLLEACRIASRKHVPETH